LGEALQISRELAKDNPEMHLLDLARALGFSGMLSNRERNRNETRLIYAEALQI
jgi:hypothetical protein